MWRRALISVEWLSVHQTTRGYAACGGLPGKALDRYRTPYASLVAFSIVVLAEMTDSYHHRVTTTATNWQIHKKSSTKISNYGQGGTCIQH